MLSSEALLALNNLILLVISNQRSDSVGCNMPCKLRSEVWEYEVWYTTYTPIRGLIFVAISNRRCLSVRSDIIVKSDKRSKGVRIGILSACWDIEGAFMCTDIYIKLFTLKVAQLTDRYSESVQSGASTNYSKYDFRQLSIIELINKKLILPVMKGHLHGETDGTMPLPNRCWLINKEVLYEKNLAEFCA